ncbi:MAG: VanW family protein [Acidimicrobiia bacterium]
MASRPAHARAPARRWRRRASVVGIPVLVIALVVGGWAVDSRGDDIARNVTLAGYAVGGTEGAELAAAIGRVATEARARPVRVVTPAAAYDTTAETLGLGVDEPATAEALRREGDTGAAPLRPLLWAYSLFAARPVSPRYTVDRAILEAALPALQGADRAVPVEPTMTATAAGTVVLVAGRPGFGIDGSELARALEEVAGPSGPIEVRVGVTELPPRLTDAEAQLVVDEANQLAGTPLTVSVEDQASTLPVAAVASWLRAERSADGVALTVDPAAVDAGLAELFAESITTPVSASFTVEAGPPVLHPSSTGRRCCAPGTAEAVLGALRAGGGTLTVDLIVLEPDLSTTEAQALGIIEEVGQPDEFGPTTRHACCQGRVENIHKIADIIRGYVILPGETLSVNGHVGERTAERGFVSAPVIYNGVLTNDIGGGVSQFATTIFNAAFFAGLDVPEYQAHTLYISRYPRGREATISYPDPDLKIHNPSPYGVLLWPTYDDTSVTVHLYSTRYVDVVAGSTSDSRAGACTRVTTPRTRTYLDGRVEQDSFFALYQPGEGVKC